MEDSVAARRGALAIGLLLGAGVSVALGVYGRVHVPTYEGLPSFGFSSTATFKAWVGSVVLALAAAQAVTALWLYGRLPGVTGAPRWLGRVHRTTGFVAFALSLPVAAYCLYGFGFAPAPLSARTLVHSIAGCAVLRRLRRQGALRAHPGAPAVGAPGDRSAAAHRGRGGVADQRPVALLGRRSPPVTASRGRHFTAFQLGRHTPDRGGARCSCPATGSARVSAECRGQPAAVDGASESLIGSAWPDG